MDLWVDHIHGWHRNKACVSGHKSQGQVREYFHHPVVGGGWWSSTSGRSPGKLRSSPSYQPWCNTSTCNCTEIPRHTRTHQASDERRDPKRCPPPYPEGGEKNPRHLSAYEVEMSTPRCLNLTRRWCQKYHGGMCEIMPQTFITGDKNSTESNITNTQPVNWWSEDTNIS